MMYKKKIDRKHLIDTLLNEKAMIIRYGNEGVRVKADTYIDFDKQLVVDLTIKEKS